MNSTTIQLNGDLTASHRDHGPFTINWTGKKFYPQSVKESVIDIQDIAHSLARQCRFNGAIDGFYSVAQHSVYASYLVNEEGSLPLQALLHDASEAYLVDIPRPIKRLFVFEEYRKLETEVQAHIYSTFGLPPDVPEEVKVVDNRLVITEALELGHPEHKTWAAGGNRYPWTINSEAGYNIEESERRFLERFEELYVG